MSVQNMSFVLCFQIPLSFNYPLRRYSCPVCVCVCMRAVDAIKNKIIHNYLVSFINVPLCSCGIGD